MGPSFRVVVMEDACDIQLDAYVALRVGHIGDTNQRIWHVKLAWKQNSGCISLEGILGRKARWYANKGVANQQADQATSTCGMEVVDKHQGLLSLTIKPLGGELNAENWAAFVTSNHDIRWIYERSWFDAETSHLQTQKLKIRKVQRPRICSNMISIQ